MAGLSTNAPGLWGGFAGLLYGSTSLSTPPGFLADAPPAWVPDGGVLAFEFDNGLGYNSRNLATTTPDSILTYTNPSPKLVYGSDGVLGYAPHNLLLQSNTFDTTWTNVNSSETLNATTDPDGGNDATKLHVDTTASSHTIRQNVTLRTGVTYTFSIRAKEGELGWLAFDDGLSCNAYFNLSTGERGSFSNCTSTIAPLGSGWHLITITFVAAGTGGVPKIYVAEANNDVTFAGANTTDGLFIYRAQLNLGSSALTYVPTTTAAVYSLPIDHNPTTFEPLGVLIEEQRQNLLTYSEQFDNPAWVKTVGADVGVTANATATVAPDGTTTADLVWAVAANGYHNIRQGVTTAGAVQSWSVYVKPQNYNKVGIREDFAVGQFATFLLSGSGSVIDKTGGTTATITALVNGWYRITFTGTSTSANMGIGIYIMDAAYTTGDPSSYSYTGNDADGVYLWGAQQEAGSFPTSYVPTVASQVTRLADQVSILTSAFAYSATEGTVAVQGSGIQGVDCRYVSIINASTNARTIDVFSPAGVTVRTYSDAAGFLDPSPNSIAALSENKVAAAYKLNDYAVALNGGSVSVDTTTAALPTADVMRVGRYTAQQPNGHIKRLTYFPTRRTDADLQVLTRGDDLVWGAGDYLVWGSGNNLTW